MSRFLLFLLCSLTALGQINISSKVSKAGDTMTGPLVIQGGTVTASTPVLDLSQTWNLAGTTFTGLKFNVTDSASASSSLLFDFQVGGVTKVYATKTGSITTAGNLFVNTGALTLNDTVLIRSAANTLDLRNLANAQTWNVYGTYTDASNYRRLRSTMTTGGAATISAEGLGTGVSGNTLALLVDGASRLSLDASAGTLAASYPLAWSGQIIINGVGSGQTLLRASSGADADHFLKLGVNTSAAAGIKRVGTSLRTQLNDDSGYAAHHSLYDRFGSGTPEGSQTAPVGATYHRTDGGAGTSFYVKESGSGNTGWVAK